MICPGPSILGERKGRLAVMARNAEKVFGVLDLREEEGQAGSSRK